MGDPQPPPRKRMLKLRSTDMAYGEEIIKMVPECRFIPPVGKY
jgi:hypothetical protein